MIQSSTSSSPPPLYDLLVIGGGVVGLSILRSATLEGWNCGLVEAEPDLLSNASGSNSGIVCTGVDANPGSLERALIRDSISQFRIYCTDHGIPIRPCGSLVCRWPWDDVDDGSLSNNSILLLDRVLEESHLAGDTHTTMLTGEQVSSEKEENLAHTCVGAVHIPGEIVVDPWLYSISLAVHAVENGADIYTNFPVDIASLRFDGIWTFQRDTEIGMTRTISSCEEKKNSGGVIKLRAKAVVNAAGIWSDLIDQAIHGTSKWKAKPRRGQYRVYNSNDKTRIKHPIQPIPTQRTKGIFIFSTIYNQLVVGPTALDQSSRTDRSIDPNVSEELDSLIQRIIPELDVQSAYVGDYVGIRPGTNQPDYQIYVVPQKNWIAAAGIRSTGLTASLGIGNYVMRQLYSILDAPPTYNNKNDIRTTPMPALEEMVTDFQEQGDGCVNINGHRYRVTHPLSRFGLESFGKI